MQIGVRDIEDVSGPGKSISRGIINPQNTVLSPDPIIRIPPGEPAPIPLPGPVISGPELSSASGGSIPPPWKSSTLLQTLLGGGTGTGGYSSAPSGVLPAGGEIASGGIFGGGGLLGSTESGETTFSLSSIPLWAWGLVALVGGLVFMKGSKGGKSKGSKKFNIAKGKII